MINNEFYKDLGEKWFAAEGDAVALLRRENETKAPWVVEQLRPYGAQRVLDVGCGGGFLSLHLADRGFAVTALDVDESVMAGGRARDPRARISWQVGTAEALPFEDASFDAVCMMDVLEHVADPRRAVEEALRVLRPEGRFLFHTFNRTWLAWLLAAKGLDWFIRDSQPHVHEWSMFIKPTELARWLEASGFEVLTWSGIQPEVTSALRLLLARRVPNNFRFRLSRSLQVGYLGVAGRVGS